MAPLSGGKFCFAHAPERARDRATARRRGGRQTQARGLFTLPESPELLREVPAVQAVLERTVYETLAQKNSAHRSRAIGSLLLIALKSLEVGELESRLAALEAATLRPRRMAWQA